MSQISFSWLILYFPSFLGINWYFANIFFIVGCRCAKTMFGFHLFPSAAPPGPRFQSLFKMGKFNTLIHFYSLIFYPEISPNRKWFGISCTVLISKRPDPSAWTRGWSKPHINISFCLELLTLRTFGGGNIQKKPPCISWKLTDKSVENSFLAPQSSAHRISAYRYFHPT